MNFYDLYTRVEDEVQDVNKRAVIKDFINRIYFEICNEIDKRLLMKFDDFTLTAGVEDYDLPDDCGEIIGFYKADVIGLSQEPDEYMSRIFLDDAVLESDDFLRFMVLNFENPDLISVNEPNGITLVSSTTVDTMSVTITGADKLFARFSQATTLTGITTVTTCITNGVTKIRDISITGPLTGALTIRKVSDSSIITVVPAGTTHKDWGLYHRQIKITEVPTGTTTIKIAYYRQPSKLVYDYENPILPEYIHDVIVAGVLMKYYKYVNNIQLSKFWQEEYEIGKSKANDRETRVHTRRDLEMVVIH
jgi:hypothetical protein